MLLYGRLESSLPSSPCDRGHWVLRARLTSCCCNPAETPADRQADRQPDQRTGCIYSLSAYASLTASCMARYSLKANPILTCCSSTRRATDINVLWSVQMNHFLSLLINTIHIRWYHIEDECLAPLSNKLWETTAISTGTDANIHLPLSGSCKLICSTLYANMKLLMSGCCLIPHYSPGSGPVRFDFEMDCGWLAGNAGRIPRSLRWTPQLVLESAEQRSR